MRLLVKVKSRNDMRSFNHDVGIINIVEYESDQEKFAWIYDRITCVSDVWGSY